MLEGQCVSIFNYEGVVTEGTHGYYIDFGYRLGQFHLVASACIAKKFNKDFERISEIISENLYKNIDSLCVYTHCIFPEFTFLDDLEKFVHFLQDSKEEPISIF